VNVRAGTTAPTQTVVSEGTVAVGLTQVTSISTSLFVSPV